MQEWVSFVGIVVPLLTIAGSAVAFVSKTFGDAKESRRKQFFDLMALIDTNGSIASKVAAVYQLRYFPEHKDFIVRFCQRRQRLAGRRAEGHGRGTLGHELLCRGHHRAHAQVIQPARQTKTGAMPRFFSLPARIYSRWLSRNHRSLSAVREAPVSRSAVSASPASSVVSIAARTFAP